MIATIDSAGRIVVPKRLREELGFAPGQQLELSAVDGRLEVEHPTTPMRLEKQAGRLVAVAAREAEGRRRLLRTRQGCLVVLPERGPPGPHLHSRYDDMSGPGGPRSGKK